MDKTTSQAIEESGVPRRRWPYLLAVLIVVCGACAGGASYLTYRLYEQPRFFYCELIQPGMSRAQVKQALSSVGTYSEVVVDDPEPARTYIYFNDFLVRMGVKTVVLIYDGNVLSSVGMRSGLGDPGELPDCVK